MSVASILVVDDVDSVRSLLKTVLSRMGHDVRDAEEGASAEQLEGGVDVLQMASMLGAIGILRKPFEIDEVRELVTTTLGGG